MAPYMDPYDVRWPLRLLPEQYRLTVVSQNAIQQTRNLNVSEPPLLWLILKRTPTALRHNLSRVSGLSVILRPYSTRTLSNLFDNNRRNPPVSNRCGHPE